MLQAAQLRTIPFTGGDFVRRKWTGSIFSGHSTVDALLKTNCQSSFFFFDDEKRHNGLNKVRRLLGGYDPRMERTMCFLLSLLKFEVSSEDVRYVSERPWIGHVNSCVQRISISSRSLKKTNCDPSLSIEKTSYVSSFHDVLPGALSDKMANSGNIQCPDLTVAEGQSRAKQEDTLPGVCNEHVPSTKVKMCSDLIGNYERLAEMTIPCTVTMLSYIATNVQYQLY